MSRHYAKEQIAFQAALQGKRKTSKNEEMTALLFAPIMMGFSNDQEWMKVLGLSLVEGIRDASADKLERMFSQIVEMKRILENPKERGHRNAIATMAYFDFERKHGRGPSRAELKDFILANPKCYPGDFPPKGADKEAAWSPIFNCRALKGRFPKPRRTAKEKNP